MKKQTFEDYLEDVHAENYHGTDDDMPDAFEAWLENLDVDELITLGDSFGRKRFLEGKGEGLDRALEIMKK